MPLFCTSAQAAKYAASIGGKARSLLQLQKLDQRVPPWYVVTAQAFLEVAGQVHEPLPSDEWAQEMRQRILQAPLPSKLQKAIASFHQIHPWLESGGVAVRSSALQEDSGKASFAGLHDSFLFIQDQEALLDSLRRVWASFFSQPALEYRRARGLPLNGDAMAVVVQQMVPAHVSGVLFTANPDSGNVHEIVISALYGAGEGLVGQGMPADRWVIDKWSLEVEGRIADKREQLVADPSWGGLQRESVPEQMRQKPVLSEEQVQDLSRTARRIEQELGRPQDIEFALGQDERLYLLQCRPITTLDEYGPAAGFRHIWESGSIVESWGGITLPMTWSFVRRSASRINRCLAEVLGVRPATFRRHQTAFDNALGFFRGQVCTNILNRSRMLQCMPGFRFNPSLSALLMRHAAESVAIRSGAQPPGLLRRWLVELPALMGLLLRTAWNFFRLEKRVGDFRKLFEEEYSRCQQMDFASLKPHQLMELYLTVEDRLMGRWHAPLINGLFVPVFHGSLARLCQRWCGDRSLRDQLVAGQKDLESSRSGEMLLDLARQARSNPELKKMLSDELPEKLPGLLQGDPRFEGFCQGVEAYIRLYHFRCPNELMLEQPSLRRQPLFLFQMLRNYVNLDDLGRIDVQARQQREERKRHQAEETVRQALGWRLQRRILFRWILKKARLGVRNRENIRYARIRMFGLARELMWALADRFAAQEILQESEDFFYLSMEEVWDYLRGTALATDLQGLVNLRRQEYEAYATRLDRPDDIFETFGIPYRRNRLKRRPQWVEPLKQGSLQGTGCSPGQATGPVKIIRAHEKSLELTGQEILVVEQVNPAWVALYPSIAGLLIEQGDTLAHSLIVAREMGIPAVCGIVGLTKELKDGQIVSVDGGSGAVVVEEEESHAETQRRGEGDEKSQE